MSKFKEGQEVILVYHSGHMTRKKIAKEYKNGNFILEGSKTQYRPSGFVTGQWEREHILPITNANIKQYNLYHEKLNLRQNLQKALKFDYKGDVEKIKRLSSLIKKELS